MSNQLLQNIAGFPQPLVKTCPASTELPVWLSSLLGASLSARPLPWPLPSPPWLCSRCTLLPLHSAPTVPTLVLVRVTLQSLLHPQEGLFLPPGPSPASLASVFLQEISKIPYLQSRVCTRQSHTHLQIPVWHRNALCFGFSDEHFKVFLRTQFVRLQFKPKQQQPQNKTQLPPPSSQLLQLIHSLPTAARAFRYVFLCSSSTDFRCLNRQTASAAGVNGEIKLHPNHSLEYSSLFPLHISDSSGKSFLWLLCICHTLENRRFEVSYNRLPVNQNPPFSPKTL